MKERYTSYFQGRTQQSSSFQVFEGEARLFTNVGDPVSRKGSANKDTWVDLFRASQLEEVDLLMEAAQMRVTGVPRVQHHWKVKVNSVVDSTDRFRSLCGSPSAADIETRVHHQLVLGPFTLPLETFRSKRELLFVFFDAILGTVPLYVIHVCVPLTAPYSSSRSLQGGHSPLGHKRT